MFEIAGAARLLFAIIIGIAGIVKDNARAWPCAGAHV